MNKAAIEILQTLGPSWALVPSTKRHLSTVFKMWEEVNQIKLTVKHGFVYVRLDPKIYFRCCPPDYLSPEQVTAKLEEHNR